MTQTKIRKFQIENVDTWLFDTSTTMADPGTGKFRLNNATPASATAIAISITDKKGFDITPYISELDGDDVIIIQQISTPNKWVRYLVAATPTNNTTWFQISLTLLSSSGSGSPASNVDANVKFAFEGFSLSNNEIKDIVGEMVTGNIESAISVTYDGSDHNFDFIVDVSSYIREKLTGNRTYYVRTDGSDSNGGLANNSGNAFLTIQKAVDVISDTLDIAGKTVTIQVGDGTYTGAVTLKNVTGFSAEGTLVIQGNSGTPDNVVISTTSNHCFTIDGISTVWTLKDMKLQTTTSGIAINCINHAKILFSGITFGACATYHILAQAAMVKATGNYAIKANAPYHWVSSLHGEVLAQSITITLTGTPAFSGSFLVADTVSTAAWNGSTFSGSGTGKRYDVNSNAATVSGGVTLPGNVAGTTGTGGQYL